MGNLKWIAILLLVSGCGSSLNYSLAHPTAPTSEPPLQGTIQMTDGTTTDIGKEQRPFLLMFATYTCLSCRDEVKRLLAYFQDKPGTPKNVRLITVLAGADLDLAQRWKTRLGVTWEVGVNPDDPMFKSRCPERLTPCLFTQNFNDHPPVHRRVGEADVDDLEKETGPWTY